MGKKTDVKIAVSILLLLTTLVWACKPDDEMMMDDEMLEVQCTTPAPESILAGDSATAATECFVLRHKKNESLYAWREELSFPIDLNLDGQPDVEFILDDDSYGIAGPTRCKMYIVPISDSWSIAEELITVGEDSAYFAEALDYGDTISSQLAWSSDTLFLNWEPNIGGGNFTANEVEYIAVKERTSSGVDNFGWIAFELDYIYGARCILHKSGMIHTE